MPPPLTLRPQLLTPLLRRQPFLTPHRLFASSTSSSSPPKPSPKDHALNRTDELDVESNAVHSGQRERAEATTSSSSGSGGKGQAQGQESSTSGSAITEKDPGGQNKKAEKQHGEAPGPVIGMNDERGGKEH